MEGTTGEKTDQDEWMVRHRKTADQKIAVTVTVAAASGQAVIVNALVNELNDVPMSEATEKAEHLAQKEKNEAPATNVAAATSEAVNAMAAVVVTASEKAIDHLANQDVNHERAADESAAPAMKDEAQAAKTAGAEAEVEGTQTTDGSEYAILKTKASTEMRNADARIAVAEAEELCRFLKLFPDYFIVFDRTGALHGV